MIEKQPLYEYHIPSDTIQRLLGEGSIPNLNKWFEYLSFMKKLGKETARKNIPAHTETKSVYSQEVHNEDKSVNLKFYIGDENEQVPTVD